MNNYFVSSSTTTDFEGMLIVRIPPLSLHPLNETGLTASGFSKELKAFISLAVRTSPVTLL